MAAEGGESLSPEGRVPLVHHGGDSFLDNQVALLPAALALHITHHTPCYLSSVDIL